MKDMEKEGMFYATFHKSNGKLVPINQGKAKLYKMFVESLAENQSVEVYLDANIADKTLPQLGKLYSMIRTIAKEQGESFEDVKLRTKQENGFCIKKKIDGDVYMICKSFAECSKDEISGVIQYLVEKGTFLNINFH